MRWRLSVLTVVFFAVACSNGSNPLSSPAHSDATASLPIDPTISIRVLPNLDGNNVVVTGFNQYDLVTGYITTGSTPRVFRSRTTIEYFTPPSGFQPGNFFGPEAGINASGKVVGGVINDTSQRAYIWWHNGSTTLFPPVIPALPQEGPLGCGAWAINDSDYVVGTCMPNVNWFETVWGPNGTVSKQTCCGVLTAIANNQYITGYDLTFDSPIALLWAPGAPMYTLIGVDNGTMEESKGLAVNKTGWAAGWAIVTGVDSSAILWVPGQSQRILSHLGLATGVDGAGNVVGYHRDKASGPTTAFLWNSASGAHFLPGLAGGGETGAVAINSNHEILGWAFDKQGLKHAVIWQFH